MTTEQFIQRAQETHGSYYDYSCTEYASLRTPTKIICPTHGQFKQLPSNHLKGSGCKHCSYQNKTSKTDDFIAKSHTIHLNKYDYSQVSLSSMNDRITIICPIHGVFEQRAASHLDGRGCLKCSGKHKSNTEDFIEKSCKKHGDKYDYSCVDYINSKTGVIITCPQHGNFEQTPSDHLHGYGCPTCAGNIPITREMFVESAIKTHGDWYDYSKLSVHGMNKKETIICPVHGEFEQRLADHVSGSGCPTCSLGKMGCYSLQYFESHPDQRDVKAVLYLVKVDEKYCKIGITKRNIAKRFANKNVQKVLEIETYLYDAYLKEQQILDQYKEHRYRGGPLRSRGFVGWTECFPLELLDDLKQDIQKVTYNG